MQLAVLVCLLGSALSLNLDKPKNRNLKVKKVEKKVEEATPVEAAPADKRARELGYLKSDLAASVAPFNPRFGIIPSKHKPKGAESTDVEIFWQRPATAEVKGVMFGATGCFHQGGDFFEHLNADESEFEGCKHSKLRRCQGLPENVYLNKYARERGYLFLTITPSGMNSCWDHEQDPARIHAALDQVLKIEGLPADLPMFATGASQGGYLMYDLQAYDQIKNLKCIAPQAAEMKYKTHKEHLPTMILWMPRDFNLTNPIQGDLEYLRSRKLRVAERTPHPWSVSHLMKERGYPDEITDEVVKRLKKAKSPFAQKGKMKFAHKPMTETGYIVDHPGTDSWWIRPIAQYLGSRQNDTLVKDHSKFHQIMQTAYAEHEFTAEYTDHIIDFCEDHEKSDELLRFDRKPEILKPRKFALICSPTCPKAGGGGGSPAGAFKFPKMKFGR